MDKLKRYRLLCHFIADEYKFIEQLKSWEVFADTTEYQQQSYKRIEKWERTPEQLGSCAHTLTTSGAKP